MSESTATDLVIILITGTENPKRLPSAFFLAATAAAGNKVSSCISQGLPRSC